MSDTPIPIKEFEVTWFSGLVPDHVGRDRYFVEDVSWQRNGSGGTGFFVVRFSSLTSPHLIGIIHDDTNGNVDEYCAIIDPFNLDDHFRGADHFAKPLRTVAQAWFDTKYPRPVVEADS